MGKFVTPFTATTTTTTTESTHNTVKSQLNSRQLSGALAEEAAYKFLLAQGLKVISRNYRIPSGEIDLIMKDDDDIVFVEVRFRKHNHFGDGADSVTATKQNKIYKTALHFIQRHPTLSKHNFRFDVMSMSLINEQFDIEWIDDAFQPAGV